MDDVPAPRPPASPGPGERPGGARLDRAPGTRYAAEPSAEPSAAGSPVSAVALAILLALLGAAVLFVVGNLDIGVGLIAIAAAVGWITGLALSEGLRGRGGYPRGPLRMILAATIAAVAVGGALLGLGVYAIVQGGVLSPIDYLATVYGPLALVDVLAAAAVAAVRAR